jgi:hypothetical protein
VGDAVDVGLGDAAAGVPVGDGVGDTASGLFFFFVEDFFFVPPDSLPSKEYDFSDLYWLDLRRPAASYSSLSRLECEPLLFALGRPAGSYSSSIVPAPDVPTNTMTFKATKTFLRRLFIIGTSAISFGSSSL